MKNLKFWAVALMCAAVLMGCDKKEEIVNVATFENISLGADSINSYTSDGLYNWSSGDFGFSTGVAYELTYYFNYVVSSQKSNTYSDFTDQYHSAPGGAAAGNNFAVAFLDTYTEGASLDIKYTGAATFIPGTYVTNNAYAATVIKNGNDYARAFEAGDYFKLTFTGYLLGVKTGSVDFYLADYRNGKSLIVREWTYVELKDLGLVDEIKCTLESTDTGDYGMNTPAYFCLDNFGARK